MDDLAKLVAIHGAKGLAYIKIEEDGSYGGPIAKFFEKEVIDNIARRVEAVAGDCIIMWRFCFSVNICVSPYLWL